MNDADHMESDEHAWNEELRDALKRYICYKNMTQFRI